MGFGRVALPPGSPINLLPAREKEPPHSGSRSKAMSLGWGDGGLEGDMGLEPDGPPSPHPCKKPDGFASEEFDSGSLRKW